MCLPDKAVQGSLTAIQFKNVNATTGTIGQFRCRWRAGVRELQPDGRIVTPLEKNIGTESTVGCFPLYRGDVREDVFHESATIATSAIFLEKQPEASLLSAALLQLVGEHRRIGPVGYTFGIQRCTHVHRVHSPDSPLSTRARHNRKAPTSFRTPLVNTAVTQPCIRIANHRAETSGADPGDCGWNLEL